MVSFRWFYSQKAKTAASLAIRGQFKLAVNTARYGAKAARNMAAAKLLGGKIKAKPDNLGNLSADALLARLVPPYTPAKVIPVMSHLYKLQHFRSAAAASMFLDLSRLSIGQTILVGRVWTCADRGAQADEMLLRLLRVKDFFSLQESEKTALIDWVSTSGLDAPTKRLLIDQWMEDDSAADEPLGKLARHLRWAHLRLRMSAGEMIDINEYLDLDIQVTEPPDYAIRYVTHLISFGMGDEAKEVIRIVSERCEPNRPSILSARLLLDPGSIETDPAFDPEFVSKAFVIKPEIMEFCYNRMYRSSRCAALLEIARAEIARAYVRGSIYRRNGLLKALLKVDLVDDAIQISDRDRIGVLLPRQNALGLAHFAKGDYRSARACFMKVINEDAADTPAAEGLRLAFPRTGGDVRSMLKLREQIGYGSKNHGRIGMSRTVGAEFLLASMMSGDYLEATFAKRKAMHWQFLKRLYGEKFINYESLQLSRSKQESIFVIADEGVGDEIRVAQFYRFLADNYRQVTATCDPRLLAMFERSFPDIKFIPVVRYRKGIHDLSSDVTGRMRGWHHRLTDYLSEACREHMDAADNVTFAHTLLFNHFAGVIPRPRPGRYLFPPNRHPLTPGVMRVGLLWRSHVRTIWRNPLYLKVEDFSKLFASVEGAEFWSVQHEIDEAERQFCDANGVRMIENIDMFNDFEGLADYLASMSAVVGISSLPMELAAALGTPVLLPGFSPETYFFRSSGGVTEVDQLSMNSTVVAPKWIDFTDTRASRIEMVMDATAHRLVSVASSNEALSAAE